MSNPTATFILILAGVFLLSGITGWAAAIAARRPPPEAMRHYEQTLADMQQRLERTEQRSDRQQEQIDQLREALALEQDYSRALARAMREAGLEPPPRPALPQPAPGNRAALAQQVAQRFSISEIDDVAIELEIDGALTGDSRDSRAASLVSAATQRGKLPELLRIARRDRPRGGF